jgi:hypothetical protein
MAATLPLPQKTNCSSDTGEGFQKPRRAAFFEGALNQTELLLHCFTHG